jgi:hypothetical protein
VTDTFFAGRPSKSEMNDCMFDPGYNRHIRGPSRIREVRGEGVHVCIINQRGNGLVHLIAATPCLISPPFRSSPTTGVLLFFVRLYCCASPLSSHRYRVLTGRGLFSCLNFSLGPQSTSATRLVHVAPKWVGSNPKLCHPRTLDDGFSGTLLWH